MQNDQRYTHRHGIGVFGWVVVGLLALLVIGAFAAPLLWSSLGMMAPNTVYPRMSFGWFFFFPFGIIFFIFILFFALRWLFFPWGGRYYYGGGGHYGDPEMILKRRYARGEITKDQFDQMMRDLEQHK